MADYVSCYLKPQLEHYRLAGDDWVNELKQILEDAQIDIQVDYDRILESLPPKLSARIRTDHIDRVKQLLNTGLFSIYVIMD